jgi:hypothetical protein
MEINKKEISLFYLLYNGLLPNESYTRAMIGTMSSSWIEKEPVSLYNEQ